jgi:hypothetical protein
MLRVVGLVGCLLLPGGALAQASASRVAGLVEAMGLPEVMAIMREEGIRYGATIEEQMFPLGGGSGWRATVEDIYRVEDMTEVLTAQLEADLTDDSIGVMQDFFASETGRRIVSLEVSARRALLDEAVEEQSRAAAEDMRLEGGPRVALVEQFAEVNQLVEQNVVGALNANLAFYQGLDAGGAFPGGMSEAEILADVWGQEPEVRADTETWVYSYLLLAYAPLQDAELEAYVAFSGTDEGQALNRALFAAFDTMFVEISRDLGRAAARFMAGEPL